MISELVNRWCDRRDLQSLRVILAAWPRVSGLTDDWGQLLEALRILRSDQRLPEDERTIIADLVVEVEPIVYLR